MLKLPQRLRRRADMKLARLLVRAAGEDQRIIEAAYYPALDATFSGTYIPVTISTLKCRHSATVPTIPFLRK